MTNPESTLPEAMPFQANADHVVACLQTLDPAGVREVLEVAQELYRRDQENLTRSVCSLVYVRAQRLVEAMRTPGGIFSGRIGGKLIFRSASHSWHIDAHAFPHMEVQLDGQIASLAAGELTPEGE